MFYMSIFCYLLGTSAYFRLLQTTSDTIGTPQPASDTIGTPQPASDTIGTPQPASDTLAHLSLLQTLHITHGSTGTPHTITSDYIRHTKNPAMTL